MKKIIFFLTAISLFTFHGCEKDLGTIDNRIAITDKVITSGGSANISGTISCPIENINIKLLVDDAEDMSTPTKYNIHINSDNSFTVKITDLNPTTTYYYKYVAHTAVDMAELDTKSFTTMDATLPTVSTNNVTSITTNSAVCRGNVTSEGNLDVTSRGVCWSTSPNPTINDNKTNNGTGTGSFTSNITGLTDNTTYYVRAYATNSKGTAYGEERSFTTFVGTLPNVSTNAVSSITSYTAVCGGIVTEAGNTSVTSRGVCWSTSPNPTINDNKTYNGRGTGGFTSNITGLTDNTTYYVRAYATNSKGTAYGEEKSFTTLLPINGHDWVDLGLPSGLKWATCNVGATRPEAYGTYYAWGETVTKSEYTKQNSVTSGRQISDISGNAQYDAARANWGGTWRMPTFSEMLELEYNCTWTLTSQSGVNGCKVTGPNGNSIFLPAAGCCSGSSHSSVGEWGFYWSSTPRESDTDRAYYLYSNSTFPLNTTWDLRYYGRTVRPVSD